MIIFKSVFPYPAGKPPGLLFHFSILNPFKLRLINGVYLTRSCYYTVQGVSSIGTPAVLAVNNVNRPSQFYARLYRTVPDRIDPDERALRRPNLISGENSPGYSS